MHRHVQIMESSIAACDQWSVIPAHIVIHIYIIGTLTHNIAIHIYII